MNLVRAEVDDGAVSFAGFRIPLDSERRPRRPGSVILGVRPQDFEDVTYSEPGLPQIEVTASVLEALGSAVHVIFPIEAPPVHTEDVKAVLDEDDEAKLIADDDRSLFTAAVDPRSSARHGDKVQLTVNPARFHFFDPDTGLSLAAEPTLAAAV